MTLEKNQKILVTGGAGFIGSALTRSLLNRGYETIVLDDFSTGKVENLSELQPSSRVVNGSILDEQLVDQIMQEVDFCFHLAATVGVRKVVEEPEECLKVNLYGSENILRSSLRYGCPTLITSTSEVYGKIGGYKISENSDRLLGSPTTSRWVYAESKALEELLAMRLFSKHGLPIYIVRLFNTVGPKQLSSYGMVIPNFVIKAVQNEPLKIHGDGSQIRAFCHVEDAVEAMIAIASSSRLAGEVFNVGSDEETSILQLAKLVTSIAKSSSKFEFVPLDSVYGSGFEEISRRVADISKISRQVGWRPRHSLQSILLETIEYWQKALNR